jgi:hypothetical protein
MESEIVTCLYNQRLSEVWYHYVFIIINSILACEIQPEFNQIHKKNEYE